MARPDWIPKDVWKFIKHGKRPKCIPKPVWKMLKEGVGSVKKFVSLVKSGSFLVRIMI